MLHDVREPRRAKEALSDETARKQDDTGAAVEGCKLDNDEADRQTGTLSSTDPEWYAIADWDYRCAWQ